MTMPESFPSLLIVLPTVAVLYMVLRWAIRREKRAQARQEMERVYYPRRGMKDDVPESGQREPE